MSAGGYFPPPLPLPPHQARLREVFDRLDKHQDGKVTRAEVRHFKTVSTAARRCCTFTAASE
jgi:hypothetical protein